MIEEQHSSASSDQRSRTRRVAVVVASTRDGRICPSIADWVVRRLHETQVAEVDLIDLAAINLPDDRLLQPGGGAATEITGRIADAEAYVFVTPEYNHSYPAALKRAIDWHYQEWMFKPATIVAYGVHGGLAAIEHLRGVLAELSVVTTRRVLGLSGPWGFVGDSGAYTPDADTVTGLDGVLAELGWWTDVLADARADRPFPVQV